MLILQKHDLKPTIAANPRRYPSQDMLLGYFKEEALTLIGSQPQELVFYFDQVYFKMLNQYNSKHLIGRLLLSEEVIAYAAAKRYFSQTDNRLPLPTEIVDSTGNPFEIVYDASRISLMLDQKKLFNFLSGTIEAHFPSDKRISELTRDIGSHHIQPLYEPYLPVIVAKELEINVAELTSTDEQTGTQKETVKKTKRAKTKRAKATSKVVA